MKRNSTILVPTDFSEVADCAIEHAVKTAETVNEKVTLLHVVKDSGDVESARTKVNKLADQIRARTKVEIETSVRIGNIFNDIGDAASEIGAELIFMGTHGMKGMQKVFGSYALKVITHSKIPFIVVQARGIKETGYNDIVVPLDISKETKQKLKIVAEIARYFNSRVHLITPSEDDEFLRNQVVRNLNFSKQYLEKHKIQFSTTVGDESHSSFDEEIISFAQNMDADLIAIMNLNENSLMSILGSSFEQKLITNEAEIPVLCLNPIQNKITLGGKSMFP